MKAILVIVAKEPVPGKVKTRLLPRFDARQASELYRLFIKDMVEELSRLSHRTLALAYTPEEAEPTFRKMVDQPLLLFPQEGADLGERLANIFERMFREGYEQVLIINSDSPDLSHRLVAKSLALFDDPLTDVVLGPCDDGGYYLVGLRRPIPELFAQIPWSTDQVLKKTLERAQSLGIVCSLSEPWYDIDTYEDLVKFIGRRDHKPRDNNRPGRRTLRYLKNILKPE